MFIKGTRTKEVTVEIDNYDFLNALRGFAPEDSKELAEMLGIIQGIWLRSVGLPKYAFIKGKDWYWEQEHNGSHTWWTDELLREVTSQELEVMLYFKQLKGAIV